jgi:hypothetical protein
LKKGGASFDSTMMGKYSKKEDIRIEMYWSGSPSCLIQGERLKSRINRPENFDADSCFIDNKIDVIGHRLLVILNASEMNNLLISLVNYIAYSVEESENVSEDIEAKICNSSLFRLWHCFKACLEKLKLVSIQGDTFFMWLHKIQNDDLRQQAVIEVSNMKPNFAEVKKGFVFIDDLIAAKYLTQNSFKCSTQAFALGLRMKGRGIDYAIKPETSVTTGLLTIPEQLMIRNNLRNTWHMRIQYSSWCKYLIHLRNNKIRTEYGQMNYFFRFRWYNEQNVGNNMEKYVGNMVMSSITPRDTSLKHHAKPNLQVTGLRVVVLPPPAVAETAGEIDLTSDSLFSSFVPVRHFISTKVGILPIDRDKKGLLPADGRARRLHLLSKEGRSKISRRRMDEVNEIILIDLNPSRINVRVGTDSQVLCEDDI